MNAPDYGRYKPSPPTAEALATRDQLAEEMAAAPPRSEEQFAARKSLVDHMLTEGLPLEDFSTSSGRAFRVRLSDPDRKQFTADTTRWLAGRDYVKVVKGLLRDGSAIPQHVLDHVHYVVSEKK